MSADQLKIEASSGRITPETSVRHDRLHPNWIRADSLNWLFRSQSPSAAWAPPLPPPTSAARAAIAAAVSSSSPVRNAAPTTGKRLPSEAEIRRRLTAYADSIPNHDFKELGDSVTLKNATGAPLLWLQLTTSYEIRSVERRIRPVAGTVGKRTRQIIDIDGWKAALPTSSDFAEAVKNHEVMETAAVIACPGCAKQGSVTCSECGGDQTVQCPSCGGGAVVVCPNCGGDRVVAEIRHVRTMRHCKGEKFLLVASLGNCRGGRDFNGRICTNCNGTGMEFYNAPEVYEAPCQQCQATGETTCGQCHGDGLVSCGSCRATGSVVCSQCAGAKRAVELGVIVQRSEVEIVESSFNPKSIPTSVLNALRQGDFEVVHNQRSVFRSPDELPPPLKPLKPSFDALLRKSVSRSNASRRVMNQRLVVCRADVTLVRYSYSDTDYEAWLLGDDVVVADSSPITGQTDDLVADAARLWKAGKHHAGASALRRAHEMSLKSEGCKQALLAHNGRLPPELVAESLQVRPIWQRVVFWSGIALFLAGASLPGNSNLDFLPVVGVIMSVVAFILRTKPLKPMEHFMSLSTTAPIP